MKGLNKIESAISFFFFCFFFCFFFFLLCSLLPEDLQPELISLSPFIRHEVTEMQMKGRKITRHISILLICREQIALSVDSGHTTYLKVDGQNFSFLAQKLET